MIAKMRSYSTLLVVILRLDGFQQMVISNITGAVPNEIVTSALVRIQRKVVRVHFVTATVISQKRVLHMMKVTRDLPVRQVQFGGLSKTSEAKYTIKRIDCYGVGKIMKSEL
jgi:hypothetical protein